MNYLYLVVAIMLEVVATTALKQTDGFTRLVPSLVSLAGYAIAFYFLSLPLRALPRRRRAVRLRRQPGHCRHAPRRAHRRPDRRHAGHQVAVE